MLRQQIATALVISPALLTAGHSGNRRLVIKKSDAFAMLALMIFHDKVETRIKTVDRQRPLAPAPIRISGQKRKAMLTDSLQSEKLVAEIENIVLVASRSPGIGASSLHGRR
ncbi:hypothetical protein M527_05735 [Sphingobium indicum IP26]|uniref:Uncharacterized protein n=1 Tax=Sphingobium indicum F2 TaxID=1450518 RepID=A0A8E0WVW7_9SPHN|nr:hypothetical protein M527_05735 [Sphingobium indicum IP26]KER38339.1 hypothetical protein AL00_01065 [Sphingobium indicum F2]